MADDRPHVTIYTDGGADPNPGPGGWAVILIHDATGRVKELSGGEAHATNNRMELTAAIRGLEALKEPCCVRFYTDSEYLRKGITEWVQKWVKDGWRRGRGKREDVENADLWRPLLALTEIHHIEWEWVKGHTGDRYNERADLLATREIHVFYADQASTQNAAAAEIYLVVSARPKIGLWAASVRYDSEDRLLVGREDGATSNRLDVLAAYEALSTLPDGTHVRVYSQSDYLRNGATQWLKGWKRRDWTTKQGQPVKNQDVWQRLDGELAARRVEWPRVKDDPTIELAFEDLARRAQDEFELYDQTRNDEGFGAAPGAVDGDPYADDI
jgi:ribonuclease HI